MDKNNLDLSLAIADEELLKLRRAIYKASLAEFVRAAWPHVSKRKLQWSWHLELICQILERVFKGELTRVIFNVPPRSLKSTLVSVLYPAWVWANDSSHQFLTLGHTRHLSTRDARYTRNLIQGEWYRELFPHVRIVSDQNQKMYYETDRGGHRNSGSFKEGLTGKGGDTITIDDPSDATKSIQSDNDIDRVIEVYEESIEQRLNDPGTSAIIIIMQRLHERDLAGWVLKNRAHEKWEHICLPLLFEKDHPNRCKHDQRTEDGQILMENRWPAHTLRTLKSKPAVFAGQYQQRPTVRGGSIFLRKSWNVWTEREMPEIKYVIMSLDTAFKPGQENDYSACTVWGLFPRENTEKLTRDEELDMMLIHAWRGRYRFPELREKLQVEYDKWVGRRMTPDVILIEDKASGQSLIQELDLAGIPGVTAWPPKNRGVNANEPSLFRAQIASEILDDGAIWVPGKMLPDGTRSDQFLIPWAEMVVQEMEKYPKDEHDDLQTTAVQAWRFARMGGLIKSSSDFTQIESTLPDETRESIYA